MDRLEDRRDALEIAVEADVSTTPGKNPNLSLRAIGRAMAASVLRTKA
jgi:hypothetical protein